MKQIIRSEIILDNLVINQQFSTTFNNYALVVDTETSVDISQKARIAMFTLFDLQEAAKHPDTIEYASQGMVVYNLTPNELVLIRAYCKENNLHLISQETFITKLLYPSLAQGAMLIGHNINFDIGALCTDFMLVPDTKQFRFKLCTCNETQNLLHTHDKISAPCDIHPTIIIEHVKTKRFIMYVEADNYGAIGDTITLGNALLGLGKSSLNDMIKRYGFTDKGKKAVESYGTPYDATFFEYAMHDVYLTSTLISAEYQLYLQHGISKQFHTIMSEASVGKAYNEKLGVPPFKLVHSEVPKFMFDRANGSYYGGRSEVHIRMKPTQILYADFKSEYPLVNALLNSQSYLLADYIRIEHCVSEAIELINSITLEDLQQKETWKILTMLVKVEVTNGILPAKLELASSTKIYGQMTVKPPAKVIQWYSMLDIIASKIRTGIAPTILDAYRLVPQRSIRTNQIDVLGNKNYHVDLRRDDFFVKVIDLRDSVKSELKQVKQTIKTAPSNELYQRKNFLENLQLALKLMANSTSYGILVETREVERKDIAGKYNAQPIGIHITAGARLLLAIAEKLGLDRSIEHAFCDTDSFAYAKPDDMHEEEFYTKVMECIHWFKPLSPYASSDEIFELEDVNFLNGELTKLYALCVSAKRYVLYNKLSNGTYLIRKMSEHGLPYYLTDFEIALPDDIVDIERDELDKRKYKPERYCLWYRAIQQIEQGNYPTVVKELWSNQLAIEQTTITTPKQYQYFNYIPDVRPFSFFVVTPKSRFKHRRDRYYMPYITNGTMINQLLLEGKVRKVKTNEVVTSVDLDTIQERLEDFFLHAENKSSNGHNIGTMERRNLEDIVVQERIRSGKKVDSTEQATLW